MDDMDEPILPDAAHVNGTEAIRTAEGSESAGGSTGSNDTGAAEHGGLKPTFLSGLATAMREAAVRERERISSAVADDANTHIDKVRSRAAIETEELRRLAEEDVEHIEQWSSAEIERIKAEAAQKIEERRSSLELYLRQHDTIIDTEIEGVNHAVRDYETTLDAFFAELGGITDPSEIVRRAGQLPTPPDLDDIRASARADAMSRFGETGVASSEPAATEPAASDPGASEPVVASDSSASAEADAPVAAAEAVSDASDEAAPQPVEAMTGSTETDVSSTSDDGTMIGVMDDGAGSIGEAAAPTEEAGVASEDEAPAVVAEAEASAPAEEPAAEAPTEETPAEPTPEPVGVMDASAQRVPAWPAPAPEAPAAPIAPTIDHTSAAVRLLRSVAPWTAPTHAGNRGSSDSD
jgi:hypothetical protein